MTVIDETQVEIGFVFVCQATAWRTRPGFDVLEGERLSRFMDNHDCDSLEKLEELAPDSKGGVGVETTGNPVGIDVTTDLDGPDDWAIDVAGYIRVDAED